MPPLIYFHLNITKIIQPLNLSYARIEDISSQVHLALSTDKFHAQFNQAHSPALFYFLIHRDN